MIEPPDGLLEAALHAQGFERVAGLDEAGRGALAGPLVAAAVVLPPDLHLEGLHDSKLVAPTERDRLHDEIMTHALGVGVYRISHTRVDEMGLHRANLKALRNALNKIDPQPDYVLVDGFRMKRMQMPSLRVVKGDMVCTSVAAASIIAKVTRDRIMVRAARRYPGYAFASNKGYRAPDHLSGLDRMGPCDIHRRCFAPVAAAMADRTMDDAMHDPIPDAMDDAMHDPMHDPMDDAMDDG